MKKVSYLPVIFILISFILLGISTGLESIPLKVKLGFLGKIGLIVGVIGLWLFTILPLWGNRKK